MSNLETLQAVAKARGGECLDTEFTTRSAHYRFRCARGHEWEAVGSGVLRGSWCLQCSLIERSHAYRDREGLARLQTLAAAKGGECLATEYLGQKAKYRFRCAEGHEWQTTGHRLIHEAWCPQCARQAQSQRHPQGLQRLQAQAEALGGICVSTEYTGAASRYTFRCAVGHEWDAIGGSVLAGRWCRQCARRKHAQLMADPEGLARLQAAARKQGGECLSDEYTTQGAFYSFRCTHGHTWMARGSKILKGQWCFRCAADARKLGIEVAHQIALERGGLCLSDAYETSTVKLRWQCGQSHEWEATMESIRQDHWCPRCAYDQQRLKYRAAGLSCLKAIVKSRNGVLHSTEYAGQDVKYTFECAHGHVWHTRAATVFHGAWCPTCAHEALLTNKKSSARLRYIASKRHKPILQGVNRRVRREVAVR